MDRLTLALLLLTTLPAAAAQLAYTPDGRTLIVAGSDGNLRLYSPPTAAEPTVLRAHRGTIHAVAVSPDGARVLTAGADGVARVWDPKTWKEVASCRGHTGAVFAVALSPNSATVATAGADRTVRLWDAPTGRESAKSGPRDKAVVSVCFSADGAFVFAATSVPDDGAPGFRGPHRGDRVYRFHADAARETDFPGVRGLTVTATRYGLVVGDDRLTLGPAQAGGGRAVTNRIVVSLLTPAGEERATIADAGANVAVSADGLVLAVTEFVNPAGSGRLRIAHQGRGTVIADAWTGAELKAEPLEVDGAAFSPDGRALAVPTDRGRPARFISLVPTIPKALAADPVAAWTALAAEDGKPAYEALWALVDHGPKGVALIAERLRPAVGPSADEIRRHVEGLDRPKFADREAATKALREAGPIAVPALREMMKKPPSEEARARAEGVLREIEAGLPRDPDARRAARAVGVLDRIGTPAARDVLKKLAAGAPGHPLTTAAADALARLRHRITE